MRALVAALLVAGCAGDPFVASLGSTGDGALRAQLGDDRARVVEPSEAGVSQRDSWAPVDVAQRDTGAPEAGVSQRDSEAPVDAAQRDSGAPEAGGSQRDSEAPVDAAQRDSGAPEAASPLAHCGQQDDVIDCPLTGTRVICDPAKTAWPSLDELTVGLVCSRVRTDLHDRPVYCCE